MRMPTANNIQDYLLEVDSCLLDNKCLNYHQILSYKHKINIVATKTASTMQTPQELAVENDEVEDLPLAEINYLCIKAAMPEDT